MTKSHSKTRAQAEVAFNATQTAFFAKSHAFEELDFATQAREEKTLRLRAARLEREQTEALLETLPANKPGKKQR